MKARWLIVALLGTGAGLGLAATTEAGASRGSSNERTHPHVRPGSGTPRTTFELSFTPRESPGHRGVMATDYRVQVAPHQGAPTACWPNQPAPISSGQKGHQVRVALDPPSRGWCQGIYHVTVFLERGPYCPPKGGQPQPCPEFATQELSTGRTRFTVQR